MSHFLNRSATVLCLAAGLLSAPAHAAPQYNLPIDVVGTGSFIPDVWTETYATADIVSYDGVPMVKVGREFLLRRNGGRKKGG